MERAEHLGPAILLAIVLIAAFVRPAEAYDCIELKCTQMTTCAEAHYKLTVCGHTARDADNDGIPCENLCGNDFDMYRARVQAQQPKSSAGVAAAPKPSTPSLISPAEAASNEGAVKRDEFTCSGKRTCGQMLSCDEAKFYLSKCGVKSLDGDHDGVPCNSLCR